MRTRWEFDPEPYALTWLFGGLITWGLVTGLTSDRDPSTASWIVLGVWLGPIVLAVGGFVILALWDARPRRVTEPVLEDLREFHA